MKKQAYTKLERLKALIDLGLNLYSYSDIPTPTFTSAVEPT